MVCDIAFHSPLQEFVENSRKLERVAERGRSRPTEVVSVEGAEMKPMVSDSGGGGDVGGETEAVGWGLDGGGGEWEELQEFHVYYLLVGVLVDWALGEQCTMVSLILCLTEDVVLFFCVYLPTSTLVLFATLLQKPSPVVVPQPHPKAQTPSPSKSSSSHAS